jgi:hypothetical protein
MKSCLPARFWMAMRAPDPAVSGIGVGATRRTPGLEAAMTTRKAADPADTPAPLVFIGHVTEAKAATIANIAAADTAIVAVDHVVAAPAMFAALAGTELTVRFRGSRIPPTGASRTFHATGWIYGAGIAVDAVRVESASSADAAAAARRGEQSSAKDGALVQRLDAAHLGVVGEVTSVRPVEVPTTRISEHDPLWHEATIKVDEVVKGRKGTREVSVVFPRSDDVRWRRVPKFHAGQQGIWLLHKESGPALAGAEARAAGAPPVVDALTAPDTTDYLPLDELGRVKALLNQ